MAKRARILDYSDREILHFINDAANPEGWATTSEIQGVVQLDTEKPNNNIGVRVGNMVRYGMVEKSQTEYVKGEHQESRWRLTERGRAYMTGRVSKTVAEAMERIGTGALLEVVSIASRKMNAEGSLRIAVRREFQHGDYRYRNGGSS